jgi:hypothetical protein
LTRATAVADGSNLVKLEPVAVVATDVGWGVATAVRITAEETEGNARETEGAALALASAALGGAGVASAGFTSAPVPHGIAAPDPGCVLSVGGVVAPEASAIANRVVQVRFVEAGVVNW